MKEAVEQHYSDDHTGVGRVPLNTNELWAGDESLPESHKAHQEYNGLGTPNLCT